MRRELQPGSDARSDLDGDGLPDVEEGDGSVLSRNVRGTSGE